jgi:demethylmenaquinone methyltransferase/2-methoxy-6-polyprenyl-1,4-benzoquinol methylase
MPDNPDAHATTHFGFRDIPVAEKKPMVRAVFDSVAGRYDVMNDLMSLGIHRAWKSVFTTRLDPRPNRRFLDLAGGTGDITLRWLEGGGGPAILSDINAAMLAVGRDRLTGRGHLAGLSCLDVVGMAFGLRNCTDKDSVLAEARRVLKPGGRFLCLEFSHVTIPALAPLYDAWSFKVLPRLGQVVAGDADSYQYLAESIRMHPDQDALAAMMQTAGFERVRVENLAGGIAAIHSGWRL